MHRINENHEVSVVKDGESEGPIPSVWRPVLTRIVDAFVHQDYHLGAGVAGVAPVSDMTAAQIRDYIRDYGEALIALPEESWTTSVCIWMDNHWDAMIDLWTEAEGRSDLVLHVQISETLSGYIVNIYMVYVP
jgi:hypothetical protein